jgi:hypothetical protein
LKLRHHARGLAPQFDRDRLTEEAIARVVARAVDDVL